MLGSAALQLFAKTTKCLRFCRILLFSGKIHGAHCGRISGEYMAGIEEKLHFRKKVGLGDYHIVYIHIYVCVIRISSRHSGGGKGQRREEMKREDQRRERARRQKMQAREKVAKPRNTVFFQWFVAPAGRKVGSLKRRVRSRLGRWEMKNCTPLRREAHLQVKMYKTLHVRATFGGLDVRKCARCCGAKHISKPKC